MIKRAQNRIAQSRWSLPVTAIYGILVFLLSGMAEQRLWPQLLIVSASTMMMVVLNNSNSLIRIYSRMVSCSFCAAMFMMPFLFTSLRIGVAQLSFIVYLFSSFMPIKTKELSVECFMPICRWASAVWLMSKCFTSFHYCGCFKPLMCFRMAFARTLRRYLVFWCHIGL